MSVVVTGAGGYIGTHLVAALRREGADVVAMVRPGRRTPLPEGLAVVEGDVTDPASLPGCLHRDDRVVHLACLALQPSEEDPEHAFATNTFGTFNVLRAAAAAGVARVVLASSSAVYGRPQAATMDEHHPTRPTAVYGATKLAGEAFVPTFACTATAGAAVLRLFNVFGKAADGRPRPTFETLIAERARASLPVTVSSTEEARDFVHVGDVVGALVAAVRSSVEGVYNIGSGRATRLHDLALAAGVAPANLFVKAAAGPPAPMSFAADIARARRDLGFRPTLDVVDFVQSLAGEPQ